jgi:predicted Ser/Thr protein kinase
VRGSLSEKSLPSVLRGLAARRESGILHLSKDDVSKRIFFRDGTVVFVGSDDDEERLGEVLVRAGKMKRSDLDLALQVMKETGESLGKTIVEMGFFSAEELKEQAVERMRTVAYSLFGWPEGQYHFEEREVTGEQDPQAVSLTPPDGTRVLAGFAPGSEPSGPIPLLPLLSGSGAIPEHLGRYEVQEIIGRGAMGAVVLARDPAIDRIVAIKLIQTAIHLSAAELEKYRERFHREAKAAGKLLHPGIVTVFDVGQGQGEIPFIVMEYVQGKTLQEVLKTEELSPGEALRIAGDVLDALSYAHSQGVVHRDIKPSNILITPDRRAKIMDFGIAHVVGSEYTQAGEVLGSPNYMAPEQLSKKKIDLRTDLFAFGVVLYRMLTGKLPFTGDSFASIAGGVLSENPAPPETINPAVSPALGRVVLRCLEKDPARRFPSANQVKAALDSPESSSAMEALSPTDRSEPASAGAAAEPTPAASADASKNDLTPARRAAARGRARLALAISVPLLLTAAVLALFFAPRRPAEEASPPLASPPPPSDTGADASGYPPQETAGPPALADGGDPDAGERGRSSRSWHRSFADGRAGARADRGGALSRGAPGAGKGRAGEEQGAPGGDPAERSEICRRSRAPGQGQRAPQGERARSERSPRGAR